MGLKYISASLERAILYLNPTIVLVLSALWLRQRISGRQVAAMLLSYAGVAIVWMHDWSAASLMAGTADPGLSPGLSPVWAITLGSVLVFLSAFSYAVYLMGSGQLVRHMGSMRLVGLASCVASGMAMAQWVIVYVGSHGQLGNVATLPWQAWALSGLNATLCTVVPIWLVMRGVQLVGASVASQVGMIGPLSTIWMAAWWLGEPVTWRLMAGTGAVLAGIVVLARAGRKPADGRDQRQAKA
jgi:drug/metabolite transporter (DMT)-like permease